MNFGLRVVGQRRASSFFNTITINPPSGVTVASSGFPLLIYGTYSQLKTVANGGHVTNSNGYDILFSTTPDMSGLIPFELVSYSATTGAVQFWVSVPTLAAHGTNTVIYILHGFPSIVTNQSNPSGVWDDNNFVSALHLENSYTDSVVSSLTSFVLSGSGSFSPGEIGQGSYLTGGYLTSPSSAPLSPGALTFSAWCKPAALSNAYSGIGSIDDPTNGWTIMVKSNGKLAVYLVAGGTVASSYDGTGLYTLSTGVWQHVAFTTVVTIGEYLIGYVNGLQDAVVHAGSNFNASSSTYLIGDDGLTGGRVFSGRIDEPHISNVVRTPSWILAEYANQSSPATFYTVT